LVLAVLCVTAPCAFGVVSSWQKYQVSRCGITFEKPEDTSVRIEQIGGECTLYLWPADWEKTRENADIVLPTFPTRITIETRNVTEIAAENGFEHSGDKWVVRGRAGSSQEAKAVKGRGWSGFIGFGEEGSSFKNGGGYAGLGDFERVLIMTDDGRVAVIESCPVLEGIEHLVETLAFKTPRNAR